MGDGLAFVMITNHALILFMQVLMSVPRSSCLIVDYASPEGLSVPKDGTWPRYDIVIPLKLTHGIHIGFTNTQKDLAFFHWIHQYIDLVFFLC